MTDRDSSEDYEGVFKKARPARPRIACCIPKGATIVGWAERTEEYVSPGDGDLPAQSRSGEGRERRWRPFFNTPLFDSHSLPRIRS